MKKKWYRSGWVKAFVILLSYITVVTAAFSGVILLRMRSAGFSFSNPGEDFTQSERFAGLVFDNGLRIARDLKGEIVKDKLDGESGKEFLDIGAFESGEVNSITAAISPSYTGNAGLVYSVEDLRKWAENLENFVENGYETPILKCVSTDGTYHYYYYAEFMQGMLQGSIECELNKELDYYFGDDENEESLNKYSEAEIRELIISAAYNGWDIGEVTDRSSSVIQRYVSCYPTGEFNGNLLNKNTGIGEEYSPKGYDNLLDFLNKNEKWNDRIEEAYAGLSYALGEINGYAEAGQSDISVYENGKTNVTYLYADLDEKKVYTNNKEYENYSDLEKNLEDLQKDSYVQIRGEGDSITNIDKIQEWNYLDSLEYHAENISDAKNYVFALQADTEFPASDKLQEAYEEYTRYVKYGKPAIAAGILAVVFWFVTVIWLTAIAGKKPGDEEIHLNWFDSIYTEIAAASVVGIWLGGILIGFNTCNIFTSARAEILIWIIALIPFTQTMFLTGWLSLVRRIKGKIIWKKSLLRWFGRWGYRIIKRLLSYGLLKRGRSWICRFFKGIGNWFKKVTNWFTAKIYGRDIVLEGLKRISGGELQYKIPLDKVSGKRRVMAEYINNIGDGLDAAVEKAMRSERMKTDLITNVSHDIKTPLTSIINYVDLLKRENFTDPKIQGYLQILDEKSQRLKILTEDVVEASKASSGNINLEMTELDFVELIHQVLGEFQEKFQEKNLTMMVHFEDEASVIRADGQRMWRVLSNIFGNVVKYAMEGTRVYAEVSNKNKKVIFTLKNISAQPLNISADELTERFIRGDISRNTEGSGLGLSIAKSLTELQGGEFKLFVDGDLFKAQITFAAVPKKEQE